MYNGNFRSGYSRGRSLRQINAFNTFQASRNSSQAIRDGFTGANRSQGSFGNIEELICQICFKSGHAANIYWHRFIEDYVPTLRGFER